MSVYTSVDMNRQDFRLGQTIRGHRKRRGWTLQDLASRLSISPASLSAIENEKARVDLERLEAIAFVLGLPPDALFPKTPSRAFHVARNAISRGTQAVQPKVLDRVTGTVTKHHNRLHPLADLFVGKHMEPFHIEVAPLSDDEVRYVTHHHEQFLFVLRGEVECLLQTSDGLARERLSPGDCIYFRSSLPHCIRSVSGQTSNAIGVMHSPYGMTDSERGECLIYCRDSAPRSLTEHIADQVAALRQARGSSAGEFAAELGLSVRQLAGIERGRRPVSLDVLLAACRRFRKPLEYFLSSPMASRHFYFLLRAGEIGQLPVRARRRLVDGGWAMTQFRSLASGFEPRGMFPYYVRIHHPGHHPFTLHEHHGQEFVYVLNGEVTLVTLANGERVSESLGAGDACFIDSTVPHRFLGMSPSPYDRSSAEVIDVFWCSLGEDYLFGDAPPGGQYGSGGSPK